MATSNAENDFNEKVELESRFDRKIHTRGSKLSLGSGPFRATQIWNDVVTYLQTHIVCKRRRHRIRYHDNCFSGSEAVNVVLTFLLEDRENFSADISREKAVKLCQMLIDRTIIKCVGSRLTQCTRAITFEDSTHKFYQFTEDIPHNEGVDDGDEAMDDNDVSMDEEKEHPSDTESGEYSPHAEEMRMQADMEPDFGNESIMFNPPITLNADSPVLETVHMLRRSVRHKSIAAIRNSFNDKKLVRQFSFREKDVGGSDKHFLPEMSEDVWKEVALSKLLTLIELPILDGVLSEDKQSKKSSRYSHALGSTSLKRCQSSDSLNSRYTHSDIWMQTALDVLERLPLNGIELDKYCSLRPTGQLKRQIYYIIADHYKTANELILPERFTDLHVRILKLIMEEKHEQAVQALQLHMILLSWQRTEELNRLLVFMVAVSNYCNCRLHHADDNNSIVLLNFTDAILKNAMISHDLAKLFVGFLLANVDKIFTIPDELRAKVEYYFEQLSEGKCAIIDEENGFCSRVSMHQYEVQAKDYTHESLHDLMMDCLNDETLNPRDRRQKLKLFQKSHPDVYEKVFGSDFI